jgi:dephospho-CoA kinase
MRRPRPRRSRRRRKSLRLSPKQSQKKPLSVAITGKPGGGKSEALQAFARHGAATISSDDIVHDLIARDADVRTALLGRFGTTQRDEIAKIVFADRAELDWLESLLHPRVVVRYLDWRGRQTAALTATEVPLLYETGGESRFDKVVVITAPSEVRDARRQGAMPDDRETRLIDDEEKVKRADYSYINTGSLDDLDAFVKAVVDDLMR